MCSRGYTNFLQRILLDVARLSVDRELSAQCLLAVFCTYVAVFFLCIWEIFRNVAIVEASQAANKSNALMESIQAVRHEIEAVKELSELSADLNLTVLLFLMHRVGREGCGQSSVFSYGSGQSLMELRVKYCTIPRSTR